MPITLNSFYVHAYLKNGTIIACFSSSSAGRSTRINSAPVIAFAHYKLYSAYTSVNLKKKCLEFQTGMQTHHGTGFFEQHLSTNPQSSSRTQKQDALLSWGNGMASRCTTEQIENSPDNYIQPLNQHLYATWKCSVLTAGLNTR